MEIIVKVFVVHKPNLIDEFQAKVGNGEAKGELNNYLLVKKNQEMQYEVLVEYLKSLKKKEIITSVFQPKNKKLQKELDTIVRVKRTIKKSLSQIRTAFN